MSKIIYHIDVNSAFLSFEAAYRVKILGQKLDLRDIPSVVADNKENRHGIILAKSIPTKRYGILTGEPINQAMTKCPDLVVVSANYSLYVEASRHFVSILKEYSPAVDQYSIDECWVEMSGIKDIDKIPV
jgi:DNA polymerase-4